MKLFLILFLSQGLIFRTVRAVNKYLDNPSYVFDSSLYENLAESSSLSDDDNDDDNDTDNYNNNDNDDDNNSSTSIGNKNIVFPNYANYSTASAYSNFSSSQLSYINSTDNIQDKSAGSVIKGIGEFFCGFFIVCDIIDTVVNVGIDVADAVSSKNKEVENAIKQATKLVPIKEEIE